MPNDDRAVREGEEQVWDCLVGDYLRSHLVPDSLYHYTSAEGLLGILRSGTVHAADCRSLSDPSEGEYVWELFDDVLRARLRKPYNENETRFLSHLTELHSYGQPTRQAVRDTRLFVSSFSTKPDDIGQWRMYAADGMGFSIGVQCRFVALPPSVSWARVIYDRDEQTKVVSQVMNGMFHTLNDLAPGSAEFERLLPAGVEAVNRMLERVRPYFKHETYVLEEEWRLVRYCSAADSPRPSVRSAGSRLVSYVPVPVLGEDGFIPLRSIMLGPAQLDRAAHLSAIRDVLADTRHRNPHADVRIDASFLPYRSIR